MKLFRYAAAVFLSSLLWSVSLFAQAEAAPAPVQLTPMQRLAAMTPMFVMVFLIFYLLVILPQRKQLKLQETLLGSLKKGELVLTTSGIIGRVAGVEADHVLLEIAAGVKVRFERSYIKSRIEKKG